MPIIKMTNFKPKIYFLYDFQPGPWGGGNQFLKALKSEFFKKGLYKQDIGQADVVIFNSYHQLFRVLESKIQYPDKIFIHRLGPVFYLHRGMYWRFMDRAIINISNKISDLTIFQSHWSYDQALKLGFQKRQNIEIIGNGIAYRADAYRHDFYDKIKLIATSWSGNPKKGFKYYKFLDESLDFTKYEMTFVGNSPINFKNIRNIPPKPQSKILEMLKFYDIFVSAVEDDACSNSLIEALSCGLPAVALNSGGNKEIVKNGGEIFENNKDVIKKIEKVAKNYNNYRKNITVLDIKEIADKYLRAIGWLKEIMDVQGKKKTSIFILRMLHFKFKVFLFFFKIYNKFIKIII